MSWVGGKKALRDAIVARLDERCDRYVEVFGGGGWVQPKKGQGRRYTEVRESSRYRDSDYWCIVDSGFCRIILE